MSLSDTFFGGFTSKKDRAQMRNEAQKYAARADLLEEAQHALEKYAKLEEESRIANADIADDLNNAYRTIKSLAFSHRHTARIANKMADSDYPAMTALEALFDMSEEGKGEK